MYSLPGNLLQSYKQILFVTRKVCPWLIIDDFEGDFVLLYGVKLIDD